MSRNSTGPSAEVAESLASHIVASPGIAENESSGTHCGTRRVIIFRVPAQRQGEIEISHAATAVQMNSAIGPYTPAASVGFHPSVNLSILKFLAFEQTFKNSLDARSAPAKTAVYGRRQGRRGISTPRGARTTR